MKLDIKALVISAAILSGVVTLILGIWFIATGYGTMVFEKLSQMVSLYAMYVTFSYDPLLSFMRNLQNNILSLGVLVALRALDAALLAFCFGFLYNFFASKKGKKS